MTGKPIYTQYRKLGLSLDEIKELEGLRAIEIIPVSHDGQVIACLNIASHTQDEVPSFARDSLETIATQIGTAIARITAEEQIKRALKEKEVLLKEIHHRVKNNMQVIASLLRLQSRHIKNKEAQALFKNCQSRVNSMALVHEKLYQSPDMSRIDFNEYIQSLTVQLFDLYNVHPAAIKLKTRINDVSLDVNTATPCGLILNELVSNSLKHAFPEGTRGEVNIVMHPVNENEVELIVSDTGIGFPESLDFRNTESLGMHLVIVLVEQLGGTIELDRSGGTAFTIRFGVDKSME
jgi:two-component sensor histidine kinase